MPLMREMSVAENAWHPCLLFPLLLSEWCRPLGFGSRQKLPKTDTPLAPSLSAFSVGARPAGLFRPAMPAYIDALGPACGQAAGPCVKTLSMQPVCYPRDPGVCFS